jgi:hypothetical protein
MNGSETTLAVLGWNLCRAVVPPVSSTRHIGCWHWVEISSFLLVGISSLVEAGPAPSLPVNVYSSL